MRYAKARDRDIANGPGIRTSLYVQGCHFHCKGCFNSSTWDFDGGDVFTKEKENLLIEASKKKHIVGLSILGGEPLDQPDGILEFIQRFKQEIPDKSIWMWTGYKIDQIPIIDIRWKVLLLVDTVVDGQFEEDKKDLKLKYCGSSNQRVLHKEDILSIYKILTNVYD